MVKKKWKRENSLKNLVHVRRISGGKKSHRSNGFLAIYCNFWQFFANFFSEIQTGQQTREVLQWSAGNWPRPAPGLLTPGSRPPPRSSLMYSFTALNASKSRAHLRNSAGSVVRGPTNALLLDPALPKISARTSDARPAITASRFTGVLLGCALSSTSRVLLRNPMGSQV